MNKQPKQTEVLDNDTEAIIRLSKMGTGNIVESLYENLKKKFDNDPGSMTYSDVLQLKELRELGWKSEINAKQT